MTVVVTKLINNYGSNSAIIAFLVMEAISLICIALVKQDLRRLDYEKSLKKSLTHRDSVRSLNSGA